MTRTVGVLGGMGPAATLDFMAKIYAADPAEREQDRVRLVVDCDPGVLDRNAAVRGAGPSPGPDLAAMAKGLVGAGADFLVIACNTAHAWTAEIEAAAARPVLSMIEAACDEIAARHPGARRIGVLAGDGCLERRRHIRPFQCPHHGDRIGGADESSENKAPEERDANPERQ